MKYNDARTYQHLYQTKRWKEIRAEQLAREPLCAMCSQVGRVTPATVADHVTPHRGNVELFHSGPLQSLCASCHSGPKQAFEATGKRKGCDVNGIPFHAADPMPAEILRGPGR